MKFAEIMKDHIFPQYQLLFESYEKAQSVQKSGHETKLDKLLMQAAGKRGGTIDQTLTSFQKAIGLS